MIMGRFDSIHLSKYDISDSTNRQEINVVDGGMIGLNRNI